MIEIGSNMWISFAWTMYGLLSFGSEPAGLFGSWSVHLFPKAQAEEEGTFWIFGHQVDYYDGFAFHEFGLGPLFLFTWVGYR
jgi:hypothetical protein